MITFFIITNFKTDLKQAFDKKNYPGDWNMTKFENLLGVALGAGMVTLGIH